MSVFFICGQMWPYAESTKRWMPCGIAWSWSELSIVTPIELIIDAALDEITSSVLRMPKRRRNS